MRSCPRPRVRDLAADAGSFSWSTFAVTLRTTPSGKRRWVARGGWRVAGVEGDEVTRHSPPVTHAARSLPRWD